MTYYHDPAGIYSTMPIHAVYLTTRSFNSYLNYDRLHGSSQAAPFVAGAAALVRSLALSLGPDAVQRVPEDTATDLGPVGWDQDCGWGLLDLEAAVNAIVFADGFESGGVGAW